MWVRELLETLGYRQQTTTLHCDNQGDFTHSEAVITPENKAYCNPAPPNTRVGRYRNDTTRVHRVKGAEGRCAHQVTSGTSARSLCTDVEHVKTSKDAKNALKKGDEVTEDAESTTEGVRGQSEETVKERNSKASKKGEETINKGEHVTKLADDPLKEGDRIGKEGAKAARKRNDMLSQADNDEMKEATSTVSKEGEKAARKGRGNSSQASKAVTEAKKNKTTKKRGDATCKGEKAVKEGHKAAKGADDTLKEGGEAAKKGGDSGKKSENKEGNGGKVVTNKADQAVKTTKVKVDRVGGGFAGDGADKGEVVTEKGCEAAKGAAKKGEDVSRTGKDPASEGTEKEKQGLPGGADRGGDTSKAAADKDKDTAKAIRGKGKDVKSQGADVAKNIVRNWDDNGGGKGEGEEEDGEGRKMDAEEEEEEGEGEHGGEAKETLHSPERKVQVEEAAEAGEDVEKKGERGEEGCRNLEEGPEGGVEEGEKGANEGDEEGAQEEPDHSLFKDGKLNKGGNVVNEQGKVVGHIEEGLLKHLVGRRVDESIITWNGCSNRIGDAELIPDNEREAFFIKPAPFESSPDATVDREGHVVFEDEYVGKGIEGDIKGLQGMKVDEDGEILDCRGNVVERAEHWEPKIEAGHGLEPQGDKSTLAGKRVNKAGDIVDSSGCIFDWGDEGDLRKRVSSMCDENRNNASERGYGICGAELDDDGEREGQNEGASAELPRCTVGKDGKIAMAGGEAVSELINGDSQKPKARPVEEDGDIVDENGSILGHAERWEEGEVEKPKSPSSGRRVNKEGNVVDEDRKITVKLTSGEISLFAGKETDNNGDVIDGDSNTIGDLLLLSDIKGHDEFHEEKEKRELSDKDKKLAQQIAYCLTQVLDKIKLICDIITRKIEAAQRTPKGLNEEQLVLVIRPLIEGGGKALTDGNGIIRGLDPDGRIQANANQKSAMLEASPEEYYLADLLKKITGTVTKTTMDGESKIEGMPQTKTDLNSLWGQLNEPLFQIIAAVGLLLQGVFSLMGRSLSRTNVMDPIQG